MSPKATSLRPLQRKLEKLELEHLREFIAQQATTIDDLRAQLETADNNGEYWRESWFNLSDVVSKETGTAIGMTKEGDLGLVTIQQEQPTCAIGDNWPGTDAIYAGISLSSDGTHPVHLILWPEDDDSEMTHADAVKHAEAVNPEMASHLPTRIQAITLLQNLKAHFETPPGRWTATKTESGNTAFLQDFDYGSQYCLGISAELRVRAVSEIQL